MTDRALVNRVFRHIVDDRALLGETRRLLRSGTAAALVGPLGRLLPADVRPAEERDWLDGVVLLTRVGHMADGDLMPVARLLGFAARDRKRAPGIDRRMGAALGAPRDDLPHHLATLVSLLGTDAQRIDWGVLVRDFGSWDYGENRVQYAWGHDYRWACGQIVGEIEEPDTSTPTPVGV